MNSLPGQATPRAAEQEVLLLCARTRLEGDARERLRKALDEPIDWDKLLTLTAGQHTTALLHHHVAAVAPERVPPLTLANLRAYSLHLAARNLRVLGKSLPLLSELEGAGAPAVVWKGPVLAYSAYPHPELRTFTDLDILVRRRDVSVVRRVLKANGYLPKHGPEVSEDELFNRRSEVVTMWNPQSEIGIDVHWGATRRSFSSVMNCDDLWSHSRSLMVEGHPIRALDAEWMLLALCVHGAKHGPYPWPKLKWVTDIEAMLRTQPPERWDALFSRARKLGCHRMLLLGLCLARELLEAPFPPEVAEEMARDPEVRLLAQPIRGRVLHPKSPPLSLAERLRFDFAVRERRRDRLVYGLARALMPSRRDLVAIPTAFRFFPVFWRLVRLGRRYVLNPSRGWEFLLGSEETSRPSEQARG